MHAPCGYFYSFYSTLFLPLCSLVSQMPLRTLLSRLEVPHAQLKISFDYLFKACVWWNIFFLSVCVAINIMSCFSFFIKFTDLTQYFSFGCLCTCVNCVYIWHPVLGVRVCAFVCLYTYRLAEMESQNCSFFTDSLSPDESLWVCHHPHPTNPVVTSTAFHRDYVCVLCVHSFLAMLRLSLRLFVCTDLYMYVQLFG